MKTKLIITGFATVLLVSTAIKLRSNKLTVEENVYRPDPEKKVLVQAATVAAKDLEKTFSYTGTFSASHEVLLVPQVHGQITGIFFNEGDLVGRGKTLIQIDDDLLQAQFIAADANYQIAKRNLERYQNASTSGGVSKIQLDTYQLNKKSAESELKQIEKQIALSRITAPFTGTITLRDAELGAVAGSAALARLTDLTELTLELSVPEKEIGMFKEGETTNIITDVYPGKVFQGKIEYVSDRADNAHHYPVKVIIKNTNAVLKAGMYGTAVLPKELNTEAISIPRSALMGSAKNPQVFVMENGIVRIRPVKTGKSNAEVVEIIEGLGAGEVVITSGHINLSDGAKVEIVK